MLSPLFLEYFKDHSLRFYYSDQCVDIRRGKKETIHRNQFDNYQFNIVKIFLDMDSGQKLFFNDSNKLFSLLWDS
jgi:hypothetical protein